MIAIQETARGVTFALKVQPRAKRNALFGQIGDALKIALTAPPLGGRANEACIQFFSERLRVPRASIAIVSGQSNRNKIIRVSGIGAEEVRKRLGI